MTKNNLVGIDDYTGLIGEEAVERISRKAEKLSGFHVANVNSTYYGGGVASLLTSLTLLMNSMGIRAGWRVLQGAPDFFGITKKMHNALQGDDLNLSERKQKIYEEVVFENAVRNHLDHDLVIVHDPQPLPMIRHYKKSGPWVWRCHVDISRPSNALWGYLQKFIEQYDAMIVSISEYKKKLSVPQLVFMPAIDPFSIKNRELDENEIQERLGHYDIPTDLPLVVQISRFDRWKDPEGVIEAFKVARKRTRCRLVLLGNIATDDPEGGNVYESIVSQRDDDIIILCRQDTALVNALQKKAAVVLQKSIREGFGLTVAEAMWKGTPVIGGNVGGIPCQIRDGENGYLVSSVEEAADRIVRLVDDPELRESMGDKARETVRADFLLPRLLEQYLDLFSSFETIYKLYL